jgi:hypothetical protein
MHVILTPKKCSAWHIAYAIPIGQPLTCLIMLNRTIKNLTDEAGKSSVAKWSDDIESAERNRQTNISRMNIYATKLDTVSEDFRQHLPITTRFLDGNVTFS